MPSMKTNLILNAIDVDKPGWKWIVHLILISFDSRQHHRHVRRRWNNQLFQNAAPNKSNKTGRQLRYKKELVKASTKNSVAVFGNLASFWLLFPKFTFGYWTFLASLVKLVRK